MDPSWIANFAQTGQSLTSAVKDIREMRQDTVRRPGADVAYLAFHEAASQSLAQLNLILSIGSPPRMLGGLWTYPVVIRAHKRFTEEGTRLVTAFGQLSMLGSHEVIVAASDFATKFGEIAKELPRQGRRVAMTPEYQGRLNEVVRALQVMILAARKDLNIPDLPDPEAVDKPAPQKTHRVSLRRRRKQLE